MTERTITQATALAGENGSITLPSYTAVTEDLLSVASDTTPVKRGRGRPPRASKVQAQSTESETTPASPVAENRTSTRIAATRKRRWDLPGLSDKNAKHIKLSDDVASTKTAAQTSQSNKEDIMVVDTTGGDDDTCSTLSDVDFEVLAHTEYLDNIVVKQLGPYASNADQEKAKVEVRARQKSRTKGLSSRAINKTPKKGAKKDALTSLLTPPSSAKPQPSPRKIGKRNIKHGLDTETATESPTRPRSGTRRATKDPNDLITDDINAVLAQVPPELLALSRKLEARKPLAEKPIPQGQPEVWADSRQALCETLPYFKKPQGGCYSNDGHVYGFLFDNIGHCREYVDPDVIICRAGGGMEMDSDGQMVQKKNQSMTESQPMAIRNDMTHKNPLVVICGNRNANAICKMPHLYCVLGWFKPVVMWAEKTVGKGGKEWVTIKYRLERLNSDRTLAWSAPLDHSVSDNDQLLAGPLFFHSCQKCNTTYPQVYLPGWTCLNADCEDFWKVDGQDISCGKIPYNPAFLLYRHPRWAADGVPEVEPAPLWPALPHFGGLIGDTLSYANTRGICCPLCGRCNSRRLFRGWVCESPGCDFNLFPTHIPVVPSMLHIPWEAAPTLVRNKANRSNALHVEVSHQHGYKVCKYTFEGIEGCLIHAAAGPGINQEPGGPDMMLANLQTEDMGLERRTFSTRKAGPGSGDSVALAPFTTTALPTPPSEDAPPLLEMQVATEVAGEDDLLEKEPSESATKKHEFEDGDLMTAFSMNYGMPYKFVASGASQPFEGAPQAVINARARLNWAARTFINNPSEDIDLNEELIFGYLQGQKIEYHDDGESGLGPRIATLSLGGRAQMHLRMKQKHYIGCSKSGVLSEDPPLVCGSIGGEAMYARRRAAWEELQTLRDIDRAAYSRRRKEIPVELGVYELRTKKPPDLVTISLSHGDIVLMDGYDIQKFLEHKVVPEGYLRFALTCRTILEDHLKADERPGYVVLPETELERYHGPRGVMEGMNR